MRRERRPTRLGARQRVGNALPWPRRALLRRAVHQHAGAARRGEIDEPLQERDGARVQCVVGRRQRQPGGLHEQPMQAAQHEPVLGRHAAQVQRVALAQHRRILGQRERCELEPGITERCSGRALLFERQVAQHFVAQRQLHGHDSPPPDEYVGRPCRPRWVLRPSPSPGANSPLDCSCPGSAPKGARAGLGAARRSALTPSSSPSAPSRATIRRARHD